MLKALWHLRLQYKAVLVLALSSFLYGLGFLSNDISREHCEEHVARWIVVEVFNGKAFFLWEAEESFPPNPAPEVSLRIFRRIGANVTAEYPELNGLGLDRNYEYPYGGIAPGTSNIPFVVTVEYCFLLGALNGYGGYRHIVTVFGFPIYEWDEKGWGS